MDAVPVTAGGRNAAAKRPKTAWALFLRDFRKNAVSEFEGRSGIGKFNNLQKAASAKWKEMSDSEKAVSSSLIIFLLYFWLNNRTFCSHGLN